MLCAFTLYSIHGDDVWYIMLHLVDMCVLNVLQWKWTVENFPCSNFSVHCVLIFEFKSLWPLLHLYHCRFETDAQGPNCKISLIVLNCCYCCCCCYYWWWWRWWYSSAPNHIAKCRIMHERYVVLQYIQQRLLRDLSTLVSRKLVIEKRWIIHFCIHIIFYPFHRLTLLYFLEVNKM